MCIVVTELTKLEQKTCPSKLRIQKLRLKIQVSKPNLDEIVIKDTKYEQ